jgi:hypothetical protein
VFSNVIAEETYIASAQGTQAPSSDVPLVGSSSTVSAGDVDTDDQSRSVALDASSLTMVALDDAVVGPESSITIFDIIDAGEGDVQDIFIESAQENMGAPGEAALTGAESIVGQGYFGREHAITGQEITSGSGTILGVPGLVALVGSEISVQQGSVGDGNQTIWTEAEGSTTSWTESSSPSSAWTPKPGSSTTWTPK